MQAGATTDLTTNAVAQLVRGRTDAYIAFSHEIVLARPMARIIISAMTPSVGRRSRALSRTRGLDLVEIDNRAKHEAGNSRDPVVSL